MDGNAIERELLRIRITGRGGQGVMLAGAILAEAAMQDGKQVTETQEYGPEARLGSTKAEVIVSNRPIAFPHIVRPDVLLVWSREGFLRYGQQVAPDGVRLVEGTAVTGMDIGPDVLVFPWRDRARMLGNDLVMNMVALGTLAGYAGVVSMANLEQAVRRRVRPDLLELNLTALKVGQELTAGDRDGFQGARSS